MARAILKGDRGQYLSFFCPACDHPHTLGIEPVAAGPVWGFDGDLDTPTLVPSVHVNPPGEHHTPSHPICHTWVRAGRIEYLSDCTHALAGQTIDLPEYPEEWK